MEREQIYSQLEVKLRSLQLKILLSRLDYFFKPLALSAFDQLYNNCFAVT